eukprot:5535247-Amphidinium_carterae.1
MSSSMLPTTTRPHHVLHCGMFCVLFLIKTSVVMLPRFLLEGSELCRLPAHASLSELMEQS